MFGCDACLLPILAWAVQRQSEVMAQVQAEMQAWALVSKEIKENRTREYDERSIATTQN